MSINLSFDPSVLSAHQRKHLSDFILDFPDSDTALGISSVASLPVIEDEPTDDAPSVANPLPWDARIHTSSRAVNKDGSFRYKRGVDAKLIEQVEAELTQLMAIPAPADAIPFAVEAPPPPVPGPVAVAPPPPPAPAVDPKTAFINLIDKVSTLIRDGKLTQEQVSSAVNLVGVSSISLLGTRLDLVPSVEATIDAIAA